MAIETVDFVFNCILKTPHDEKRNDGGSQPDSNAYYGNTMNGRRKAFFLAVADSFSYEI